MPVLLPHRYRYLHDYCVFLHDSFLEILLAATYGGVFSLNLSQLNDTQIDECRNLGGSDLYQWIEDTLGEDFSRELDARHIVRAVAGDFSLYILEALNAAKKAKLTVAFTLLRKPVQDNLLYLEWMLADKTDLLNRFRGSDPGALNAKRLSPDRRKEIISKASKRAGGKADLLVEFLYNMRYNKQSEAGFARSGDMSLHLITTVSPMATEERNFNFIFSGAEQIDSQWKNLYYILPYILYHAVYVVEALVRRIGIIDDSYSASIHLRRDLGQSLAAALLEPTKSSEIDGWRATLREIGKRCSVCENAFPLHTRNLRLLSLRGQLRCTHCRTAEPVSFAASTRKVKKKGGLRRLVGARAKKRS